MTVADKVYTATDTTLTKKLTLHRQTENKQKAFQVAVNAQNWDLEDVFNGKPIRQFVLAMHTNGGFLGAERTNPFHYQRLGLNSIVV